MKRLLYIFMAAALSIMVSACVKPDPAHLDSANELSSLKCHVYDADWNGKTTLDALSGTYRPDKGAIVFTFPDNPELYNEESLGRCRLEATVPATAMVVELDGLGNIVSEGLGGRRSLYNTTVYFGIVAADGNMKKYQAQFKVK